MTAALAVNGGRGRGGRDYNARIMGWNYRIDVLAAAFARSQLRRLPQMTTQRVANGKHLTEALTTVSGIRTPVVPAGSTHVYFFYPLLAEPEALDATDFAVEVFRDALRAAVQAEGLPIQRWQPRPLPAQTLFQQMRGFGRGCPWTCSHARPGLAYHGDEYPVANEVCRRRLVLGQTFSSLGPPQDLAAMDRYAEVFHKVLVDQEREFVDFAWKASTEENDLSRLPNASTASQVRT